MNMLSFLFRHGYPYVVHNVPVPYKRAAEELITIQEPVGG